MLDSGAMGNFVSSEWIKASHVKAVSTTSGKVLQLLDHRCPAHSFCQPPTSNCSTHGRAIMTTASKRRLMWQICRAMMPSWASHGWTSIIQVWAGNFTSSRFRSAGMQSFSKNLQQQSDLTSEAAKTIKSGLLSAKQMQRLMRKKKGTFSVASIQELRELNAVSQSESSQPQSESTKVILTEFSDVFPSDLPSSLPPSREVGLPCHRGHSRLPSAIQAGYVATYPLSRRRTAACACAWTTELSTR